MTNAQKLVGKIEDKDSRKDEIGKRLNEIAGFTDAELTAEIRTEQTALVNEHSTVCDEKAELRTQLKAARIVEGEEESRARGEFGHNGDGESAEKRALLGRVSIGDYLLWPACLLPSNRRSFVAYRYFLTAPRSAVAPAL